MHNSYPYQHLNRGPFKKTVAGVLIYSHTVFVPTKVNQDEYKLEEKSTVENHYLVGIWVLNKNGNVKGIQNKDVVNDDVFNSSYLTLVTEETNVMKRLPLINILRANEQGQPYYVNLPRIQMNESVLEIMNEAAIVADEVFIFQFDFPKLAKQGRGKIKVS